jgi:hypothetical protein
MTKQEKIELYKDVQAARDAVSRILDGPHNIQLRNPDNTKQLHDGCLDALGVLVWVAQELETDLGRDCLESLDA